MDETTYCIDGIKYWLWVATSDSVCALLLAPTRSSAELKQLLGREMIRHKTDRPYLNSLLVARDVGVVEVCPFYAGIVVGEDFQGILSSDCFSAYGPQSAAAKQKCLAHLERDLEALKTSRFAGNP